MKTYRLVSGCILSALAVLPVSSAAAVRECIVQKATPASYTWNFRQEASNIFKDIRFDAGRAGYHTGRLERTAWGPDSVSWASDVNQFNQIQSAVNDMSRKLCRLETIRRAASPWQQKAIDRIAIDVTLLADNTQDALAFADTHRETLWVPAFRRYVENMSAEARKLNESMQHAVEYNTRPSS
jgi:hypothetical protein